jgi:hypothetical protein
MLRFMSFMYLCRQCRKPTPSHSRLHHPVKRRPFIGHSRSCSALILDVFSSTPDSVRSYRRLHRCTCLYSQALPRVSPDNLRSLPRRIHRSLPSRPLLERRTNLFRRCTWPRARKRVHERTGYAPRALPAAMATLSLPRPVRARPMGCSRCYSRAYISPRSCAARNGTRQ